MFHVHKDMDRIWLLSKEPWHPLMFSSLCLNTYGVRVPDCLSSPLFQITWSDLFLLVLFILLLCSGHIMSDVQRTCKPWLLFSCCIILFELYPFSPSTIIRVYTVMGVLVKYVSPHSKFRLCLSRRTDDPVILNLPEVVSG